MKDGLSDQKGSKEAMGYGIGGQQSNTDKELDEILEQVGCGFEGCGFSDKSPYPLTNQAAKQAIEALIHRHQNQLLDKLLEEVIGEDDVQKPNEEDYGEYLVCDTCDVIIDPELKTYECNCKLRNALRATQREAINKLRSDK